MSAIGASEVVSAPARDPCVDLPERDLVGDQHHRLQARAAGLLDVVGGRLGRQARAEHRFAREVAVARVLEHRPRGHLSEHLALQAEAVDQPVERRGQHVVVGGVRVGGVRPREGDAVAAQHGHATDAHDRALRASPGSTVWISSSAVALADIDSVRSHQRTNASAAPNSAIDSASTCVREDTDG